MATPLHKNPCTRDHEIYNFGELFLGHYNNILSLYDQCTGVDKKIFKDFYQFYSFSQKLLPFGLGVMELKKNSPYPTYALSQIWSRLAQ